MTTGPGVPPAGLPGLSVSWSRQVHTIDADGGHHTWHVLDNGAGLVERGQAAVGTVLCVHGNPTWSYLWRRVIDQAPPGWRVVAVDLLGMGYSQRTTAIRRLGQRVGDLDRLTAALGLTGPVVVLAHDWGGPISLGWALRHTRQLQGVVLTNTGVHQPDHERAPLAIRVARSTSLLDLVTRRTPAFVRAATALSRPRLSRAVRDAFAAPYDTAARRTGVRDFVADIPLEAGHPSAPDLAGIREGLTALSTVPTLLVWGNADPVFSSRYLRDLRSRLPHADVHRIEDASHLVLEDNPQSVALIWDWITQQTGAEPATSPATRPDPGSTVPIRVDTTSPDRLAMVELTGQGSRVTFAGLADRVEAVAAGLAARGVSPGDRVGVLVPPGIELTTIVYAVWRLGAVVVVADTGLGLRRLAGALRGAAPAYVVGVRRGLALAAAGRVPGQRIRLDPGDVGALMTAGDGEVLPDEDSLDPDADGAVLFTSGATGPPKGAVYTRRGLSAQVGLLRDTFDLVPGERFVAAFAPFALYGPALGLTAVVPDMDPTAPDTLSAAALAEAVIAVRASALFASPAALRNVVATEAGLTPAGRQALCGPRLVLCAGAPVPVSLLRQVKALLPGAATHTPYGMTEALPVATTDPTTEPEDGPGVCVGRPVKGVQVAMAALDRRGVPADDDLTTRAGVLGEITVRGPHVKDRYDQLWGAQRRSERPAGWHRTGDVGQLDPQGRLWVRGRLAHVVSTAAGPVTPYDVERRVAGLPGIEECAVVGVGPAGTQQVVVVVVPRQGPRARRQDRWSRLARSPAVLASPELTETVRSAAALPVAAVLQRGWLPVDIRHASKVDRQGLARWATRLLHGRVAAAGVGGRRAPSRRSR